MRTREPNNADLVLATQAFLIAMRREFLERHPDTPLAEVRVPIWEQMSTADRAVLVRSIRAAFRATKAIVPTVAETAA